MKSYRNTFCASLLLLVFVTGVPAQKPRAAGVSANNLLRIIRAEDQRRLNDDLKALLADKDARVRKRAALAAGRIGDERAVPALAELLQKDADLDVRQMAAFALGEVESYAAADALYPIIGDTSQPRELGARAVEALGKIAAALPESEKVHRQEVGQAILGVLTFEADPRVSPHRLTILLGLTATLRARTEGAGPVIVRFLNSPDPRIVADALNTMARLRLKDGAEQVRPLLSHRDAIVRANAARVLGATEDKQSFDALLARALNDYDLRVRVSAIRALGALKDQRAATPLLDRARALFKGYHLSDDGRPSETNELLEIATSLGRLLERSKDDKALEWLRTFRFGVAHTMPEIDIALARIDPGRYSMESLDKDAPDETHIGASRWLVISSLMQGLAEANRLDGFAKEQQRAVVLMLEALTTLSGPIPIKARPDILRTYASFKPDDLGRVLETGLQNEDVVVRATAAELLGDLPPNETNARALIDALPRALQDKDLNDAAEAILGALAKQKTAAANDAIKTAFDSSDQLIRRRAVALLKANGAGDFSERIGPVKTRNTDADYRRAIGRIGKRVRATLWTSKGAFTIEVLPEDAPLTVDNFVQLARRGYFNGITFHRVVPNFVIQGGDPRGDGNGGPGYAIRCEVNEAPYDRAAVGMALSGKDTGGSQWFVTHAPQPHLDGGYTVFGHVVAGMDVVDNIARGDVIRRVTIAEK